MIKLYLYKIKKYIKNFPTRLLNTLRLLTLPTKSYIFVNMSVKWKGLSLVNYNFGDDLNVYLIEELTHKKVLKYDEFLHLNKANLLCIGSIIEYLCDNHSTIWGSGALFGNKHLSYNPKKVIAVRGPLTRHYLQLQSIECPNIYGDPALLLPLVYSPVSKKKYKIGFIPHYKDLYYPVLRQFVSDHTDCIIIDFQNYDSWKEVIELIVSCKMIASSSLHGLIISDAYKVPNIRVKFSDLIVGGDFKFNDYMQGVNRKIYKPLDCSHTINGDDIEQLIQKYKPINYDISGLLRTFPLTLANEYKKRLNAHLK